MLFGELALQSPAVVVFVDGDPGVDLEANAVSIANGLGQRIEFRIVQGIEFCQERATLFFGLREVTFEKSFVGVGLWIPETIFVPLAHGTH